MDHEEGDTFRHIDLAALLDSEFSDCGCPGPPPPPLFPESFPPPPPAPSSEFCDNSVSDLQVCEVDYLKSKFENPGIPSFAIIIVCAVLLIVLVTVIIFLVWRHKRKAQNLVPCKGHHQSKSPHCDISSPHNVPTYEDALINHHAVRMPTHIHRPDTQTLAPIELLDVKYATQYGRPPLPDRNNRVMYASYPGCSSNQNTSCSSTDSMHSKESREHFNPVYEEVSGGSNEKRGASVDSDIDDTDVEPDSVASEDEFAEDELSLADFPKDSGDVEDATERNFRPIGHVISPSDTFGSKKRNKNSSRSIDRNIDSYPSDTLRAKHNYYVSKDKMAPDLYGGAYGSNRKPSGHQYPSKNSNHTNNHPRASRGNYNRNSSGSGGSAVNSHSTGTPPYNDPRTPSGAPMAPSYYTAGRNNRNNIDPMEHRQSSLPHHQHSRTTPSDVMYNRMPVDAMSEYNHKMQNPPGHRPDNYTRQSSSPYGYNRKPQQTPTDHRNFSNFQPQKKATPVGSNHFSPGFNDPGGPFTIDGSNPHNSSPASQMSDKFYGPPVTSGGPSVNYPSGQNSSNAGQSNNDVHQDEEPIYNELDPVYAQRPLYT